MTEQRIVVFYWLDSDARSAWNELSKEPQKAVIAAGLVVAEDKTSITLAISWCPETEEALNTVRIPKRAIIGKVRTLCPVHYR